MSKCSKIKHKCENKENCNLTTCRYNADGKCTNEEKREECVEASFMRFIFRKKRYKHEKSIDDLKKEYDKNGEYRHIVVNDKNIPLWCCKTRQEAVEQVVRELFWNFRKCEIVDLLLYIPISK